MSDERLSIAEWLLSSGAGASARRVLGELRGAPANRLRLRARDAALAPGVYALVTLPDGVGAVVPLRPSPGRSRAGDTAFRGACDRALDEARAFLRAPGLPSLRFAFEQWFAVFGPSIGLPAAHGTEGGVALQLVEAGMGASRRADAHVPRDTRTHTGVTQPARCPPRTRVRRARWSCPVRATT